MQGEGGEGRAPGDAGAQAVLVTSLAGVAWSVAFATFAVHYGTFLIGVRPSPDLTSVKR